MVSGGGTEKFRLCKGSISKGASGFGCKWVGPEQLESEENGLESQCVDTWKNYFTA